MGQGRQQSFGPQRKSIPLSVWVVGLVVFFGTVLQPPAQFVYDAGSYWAGSVSIANGADPYVVGLLSLRGVLTSALYLPAALAARGFGDSVGGVAVLVENSLLISLVGVLLLPQLLRLRGPVTSWMVCVCAGLTWLLVGRFAPYPLTDVWAAALMLGAVVVLQRRGVMALICAGLLAGIAFNIRPAYLITLLLVLTVVFLRQKLTGLWFAAGAMLALVPQSILNLTRGDGWKPWPPGMGKLTHLQAYFASYVVRYDTVGYRPGVDPQQTFCSPAMSQAVGAHPPDSAGSLAAFYLHNLPRSLVFLAEKVGAALHWPLSAPYFAPSGVVDQLFALIVTTVVVLGTVSLVHAQSKSVFRSASVSVSVALVVWLGSLVTLFTSQPETRFAMPLVLFGIAGCAALVDRRPSKRWVAVAAIAVVVVFGIGAVGLSHAAGPGAAPPSTCAVT